MWEQADGLHVHSALHAHSLANSILQRVPPHAFRKLRRLCPRGTIKYPKPRMLKLSLLCLTPKAHELHPFGNGQLPSLFDCFLSILQ